MSVWNVERNLAGEVRPVCEFCDERGRAVEPRPGQHVIGIAVDAGWSVALYPPDFEHGDGSYGDVFQCADCNERIDAGEVLYPHESRRAARAARAVRPEPAQTAVG